ncbi:DUF2079 domain-containing protein [Planctomyces sp. SH-PL14]|uniref:DUF2079 domain-containing protein n=1 Tax=Planctomyces sp. SH-PL14 TaxID=1632864 RepID=UPI00078B4A91|nr:DUF2079 domain-containing protein [Planctomyces sp. SH-PL14]AMV16291.1 hypothetical protein VT03_00275 [Planctomyces sp. SH-PL14]
MAARPPRPPVPLLSVPRPVRGLLTVVLGLIGTWLAAVTIFESSQLAAAYVPPRMYAGFVQTLGGKLDLQNGQVVGARLPLAPILLPLAVLTGITWVGGALVVSRRRRIDLVDAMSAWGSAGWSWWFLPGAWALGVTLTGGGSSSLGVTLQALSEFALSIAAAGWIATWTWLVTVPAPSPADSDVAATDAANHRRFSRIVLIGMAIYVVVFTAMNWGLWFNMRIPHGDSAMYEEHLWNLLHGKGFRSYLDPGLFLGEHIQVIHLFLIPVYVLWPSHLLMELCESLALASGAWFVFRMAEQHARSSRIGAGLALCYLLYAPMHFLDIEIDLKTFRPEAFGIPLLLWTLWKVDQQKWKSAAVGLVLTLLVKEDYPLVFAPLGVWIALWGNPGERPDGTKPSRRFLWWFGGAVTVLSVAYLLVTVKFVIPWFKGQQVHYASYFAKFGKTTGEVMLNMLIRPDILWSEIVQPRSFIYAAHLLVPMGMLCLFAPTRLLVAVPTFMLLCLNELAQQPPAPVHHFHAPIIPVLFWAAAGGLGWMSRPSWLSPYITKFHVLGTGVSPAPTERERGEALAVFAVACAGLTGAVVGFSPLSLKFWEPGQPHYWRSLYLPGERPKEFAKIADLIPRTARVASTDFVHPRYTHHERSYDYSNYIRAVAGFTTSVPPDTEYIVIDTQHPYSEIRSPADVRELKDAPDEWELLPDTTDGYFIVLRKKNVAAKER